MRLGCHCVLYGAQIADQTDEVLEKLTLAGAEGCEIGERFFSVDQADRLKEKLAAHHIELAGMHCNGLKLADLIHHPEKAEAAVLGVAKALSGMKNRNIIATGGVDIDGLKDRLLKDGAAEPELHDPALVRTAATNLEVIAKKAMELYGAQVHYHNHSWEFADQGLIFFAIADHCPSVQFALDVGWAAVSGFDPVELIRQYPGRFHYVHLRDLNRNGGRDSSWDGGQDVDEVQNHAEGLTFSQAHSGFSALGSGDLNYPRLMTCLERELGADDWAVVEYELGNFDHLSYLKALSYVRGVQAGLAYREDGDETWRK